MNAVAFKEWAVICEALACGKQALILRKGGIAETGGEFKPEHDRFWLFPTYLHQQADGIRPEGRPLLEKCLADKPPEGVVRIRHLVEVRKVIRAERLPDLLELGGFHLWSPETVEKRFHYREPGLFVLVARTWELPAPVVIVNRTEYDGCKTWVPLGLEIPLQGLRPCMEEEDADRLAKEIARRLKPFGPA